MDIKEHSKYWIDSAEHDLESAEILYASAKYVWCLFLVHIVIEKAIHYCPIHLKFEIQL